MTLGSASGNRGWRQCQVNGDFQATGTRLATGPLSRGAPPGGGWRNEIGHGDFQAFQAGRGARCPDVARHPGPDGERSEGLRSAERPDRDLSRGRVLGELPAQGQDRGRDRRCHGRAGGRGDPQVGRHRQDRRRQDLRDGHRAGDPHSHRRVGHRRAVVGQPCKQLETRGRTMKRKVHSAFAGLAATAVLLPALALAADDKPKLDTGDTAWMLTSTALVLMMTIPGLALFYGGMVRRKNVLATIMQSFAVTCLVTVLWMVLTYSLAFTSGSTVIGGMGRIFLAGMALDSVNDLAKTIPESVFMCFQMTFAIITPALIAGAFAERMKFSAMLWFMGLWSLVVYAPIAHWVWGADGFLNGAGVLDFAGGTVVHINSGVAGLMAALVMGKRRGYGIEPMAPHNLVLSVIGASLLWVGWFGFN